MKVSHIHTNKSANHFVLGIAKNGTIIHIFKGTYAHMWLGDPLNLLVKHLKFKELEPEVSDSPKPEIQDDEHTIQQSDVDWTEDFSGI